MRHFGRTGFWRRVLIVWLLFRSAKIVGVVFWDHKSHLQGVWDEDWAVHCEHCRACRIETENAMTRMEMLLIERYLEAEEHGKKGGSFEHGN
jgi:hypothetical protein